MQDIQGDIRQVIEDWPSTTPPFNCHTTEIITPNLPINEILEDLIRANLQSQNLLQHADKILHFVRTSKLRHKLALNTASLIFTEEEQVQACYQTNSFLPLNQSKIDLILDIAFRTFPIQQNENKTTETKVIIDKIKKNVAAQGSCT